MARARERGRVYVGNFVSAQSTSLKVRVQRIDARDRERDAAHGRALDGLNTYRERARPKILTIEDYRGDDDHCDCILARRGGRF